MHTGTMIEDLMTTVEQVEQHARRESVAAAPTPARLPYRVAEYPAFSTFVYELATEHAIVGVA